MRMVGVSWSGFDVCAHVRKWMGMGGDGLEWI